MQSTRKAPELFNNFGEILPANEFDKQIIDFLSNKQPNLSGEQASGYIISALHKGALSDLTRIFNELNFTDGMDLEGFSAACIKYIKQNNLSEFFYMQTFKLANVFLNEDGTLKPEIITVFAQVSNLTKEEVLARLYGTQPESYLYNKKVKMIADKIVEGCATGIYTLFTSASNAGSQKDAAPYVKELADSFGHLAFPSIDSKGNILPGQSLKTILDDLNSFNKLKEYLNPSKAVDLFLTHLIIGISNLDSARNALGTDLKYASHVGNVLKQLIDLENGVRDMQSPKLHDEKKSDLPVEVVKTLKHSINSLLNDQLAEVQAQITELTATIASEESKLNEKNKSTLQRLFKSVKGKEQTNSKIDELRKTLLILYREQDLLEASRAEILEIPSSKKQAVLDSLSIRINLYEKLAAKLGKGDDEISKTIKPLLDQVAKIKDIAIIDPDNFQISYNQLHLTLTQEIESLFAQSKYIGEVKNLNAVIGEFLRDIRICPANKIEGQLNQFRSKVNDIQEKIIRDMNQSIALKP